MAFSEEYLSACVALRRRLQAKEVWVGDWYIDVATGELDVVSRATLVQVEYRSGRYVWVPTADQVFALVDKQIAAQGFDPARKVQLLIYKPEVGWKFQTRVSGCFTVSFAKDSLQSALAQGWLQQAVRV